MGNLENKSYRIMQNYMIYMQYYSKSNRWISKIDNTNTTDVNVKIKLIEKIKIKLIEFYQFFSIVNGVINELKLANIIQETTGYSRNQIFVFSEYVEIFLSE